MTGAGKSIDSQVLYETQKNQQFTAGPSVMACGIQVPENMAALFRICEAAGCKELLFYDSRQVDIQQQKIKRVARNSHTQVSFRQVETRELDALVEEYPRRIAVEITTTSSSLFDIQLPDNCLLVVGSERHGIPQEILDWCQSAIHLPMYGLLGSMNVSHALAITLYEWRRQQK